MPEGYIKYKCDFEENVLLVDDIIKDLILYRNLLWERNLIGEHNNISFGNVSMRYNGNQFLISGTQTGGLKNVLPEHFSLVTKYSFKKNYIQCKGKIKASSEALTHAIFYDKLDYVNAVFHIHSLKHWMRLLYRVPTTRKKAKYGSIELVHEINRLIRFSNLKEKQILVISAHKEGIICFGKDLKDAFNILVANKIIQL